MGNVVTYKNEGLSGIYAQIKIDSGERIMISFGVNEIRIFKMRFAGIMPGATICHIKNLSQFADSLKKNKVDLHPLDFLIQEFKDANDIHDLCKKAAKIIEELNRKPDKVVRKQSSKEKSETIKEGKGDKKLLKDFAKIAEIFNEIKDFDNDSAASMYKTFSLYLIAYIFSDGLYTYQKRAVMMGYLIRKAEYLASGKKEISPKKEIKSILDENLSDDEKIQEIVEFLGQHDRIGIWTPVSPYFLFDEKVSMGFFNKVGHIVFEEAMNDESNPHLNYEDAENLIQELAFKSVATGYHIHVVEEFLN